MLNREQLKNYRELRHISMRMLAKHCDLSLAMISYLESGQKTLTKKNHDELIKGINAAYQAKKIKQKTYLEEKKLKAEKRLREKKLREEKSKEEKKTKREKALQKMEEERAKLLKRIKEKEDKQ